MIKEKLSESSPRSEEFSKTPDDLFDEDDDIALGPVEPDMHTIKADDYTPEELDKYLTPSIMMPQGGECM